MTAGCMPARAALTGVKTDHIDARSSRASRPETTTGEPQTAARMRLMMSPPDSLVDTAARRPKTAPRPPTASHSALEKIRCGYHTRTGALTSPKGLDAASRLLRGDTTTRAEVARDRITHIRRLNRHIGYQLSARIASEVSQRGTSLTDIYGIGPLTAAEIITEAGRPQAGVQDKARFAMANGTAPIEASSGRVVRHRLNRGGNRQLNKALHIAAIAQIRRPGHRTATPTTSAAATRQDQTRSDPRRLRTAHYRHTASGHQANALNPS